MIKLTVVSTRRLYAHYLLTNKHFTEHYKRWGAAYIHHRLGCNVRWWGGPSHCAAVAWQWRNPSK